MLKGLKRVKAYVGIALTPMLLIVAAFIQKLEVMTRKEHRIRKPLRLSEPALLIA